MPRDTFADAQVRLATAIRTARQALGMSRAELALRLNVAYSHVSMMERGERQPSYEVLVAIAAVLDTTPQALCRSPGEPCCVGNYERQLVHFARRSALSRRQVDKLIAVGRAMFMLPDDPDLAP